MAKPTNRQIDDMTSQLARIDWHRIAQRLIQAEHTSRDAATDADGYPTRTMPEGRGNNELTSVESAANRRGFQRNPHIDQHLTEAIGYLTDTINAAAACISRIDAIDRITDRPPDEPAGAGPCEACGHTCDGTGNDRLRSGLCDACRTAKRRWLTTTHGADPGAFVQWRRRQLVPT